MSSFHKVTSPSDYQAMEEVQKTRNATRYFVQKNYSSPSKENPLTANSVVMFVNYTHDFFDDGSGKMSCKQ